MTASGAEDRQGRRAAAQNGQTQLVPSKVLGTPVVFVEAMDADGNIVVEEVESEVALLWPFVHKEVVFNKHGKSADNPVQLPKQVGQDILALLLEYCRYHRFPGRSDKERKLFDEKFIRLDTRRLCELTSAADSLDMKPLVDLSSRALARMIEGKTPEEIRETFHLPDDLTEEEKLEPVRNLADDPRIRLLNRLYAKKRKELAEKKAELLRRESGCPESAPVARETRSVEELLSFIGEEGGRASKPAKRKKGKRKKDGGVPRQPATAEARPSHAEDGGELSTGPREEEDETRGVDAVSSEHALDDSELDDEIEAFERSLNADWEDRRAELIRMAGRYQPRPTRVTTLTSLSNFKARPLESPTERESPAWHAALPQAPPTPRVPTGNEAEPSEGANKAAGNGRSQSPNAAAAGGGLAADSAGMSTRDSLGEGVADDDEEAAAVAKLISKFVERLGLAARIRVEVCGEGGQLHPGSLEDVNVEETIVGLGEISLSFRVP